MGRARQESDGFIPDITLYIPVSGRFLDPYAKSISLRAAPGVNQFRDDFGLCRARPVFRSFIQRHYAGFREFTDQSGKPPCNCRGLIQLGD